MTASRTQHLVPSIVVLLVALVVGWLSFTQEPAGAYLFPRMISVFFVALALWNFARAASGLSKVGSGIDRSTLLNLLPGVAVMALYVLLGAKNVGFYLASAITFLAIYSIYDPAPFASLRDWMKRIAITAACMIVVYVLFALVLQVQTPRGIWM